MTWPEKWTSRLIDYGPDQRSGPNIYEVYAMEAGNPKEEGNAITNRFLEGCTRWIPGDVGTRELRQEFVRIGTFVVGVGEDAGVPDQRLPDCGRRIRHGS